MDITCPECNAPIPDMFATQDEVSCPSCHKLHRSNGKQIIRRCYVIGIAAEIILFVAIGLLSENWWYALALSLTAVGAIGIGASQLALQRLVVLTPTGRIAS